MLSNRESARRSRRRKQQHLGELQTRVGQLQGENAALLEKLHALHVSFDDVMNRNRAMKESLAYLRAQVVSGGDNSSSIVQLGTTTSHMVYSCTTSRHMPTWSRPEVRE